MWLYDNLYVLVYDAYVLKMDEGQWAYDYAMSQEVHMGYDNEEEYGVTEPHPQIDYILTNKHINN